MELGLRKQFEGIIGRSEPVKELRMEREGFSVKSRSCIYRSPPVGYDKTTSLSTSHILFTLFLTGAYLGNEQGRW